MKKFKKILIVIGIAICLVLYPFNVSLAYEDFTTYTEEDPNSHITIDSNTITFSGLHANEVAYVYKDYGVNYFDGGFTHDVDVYIDSATNLYGNNFIVYSNNIGNIKAHDDNVWDYQGIYFLGSEGTITAVYVMENDGGDYYFSSSYVSINDDTPYYVRIVRDENVGTYGTLYVYVYTDSARTNLLGVESVALHTSKKDFRYLYGTSNDNATGDNTDIIAGYFENLDLSPAIDTCTCTPGADWYISSSDNCYLATSCDLGQEYGLYLLNRGEGSFSIIDGAILSIGKLESTSTDILVENGSSIKLK